MFDPSEGEAAALSRLSNIQADPPDLAVIALAFPRLTPYVAVHPALSDDLRDQLSQLGRPEVDAALRARAAGAPAFATPIATPETAWPKAASTDQIAAHQAGGSAPATAGEAGETAVPAADPRRRPRLRSKLIGPLAGSLAVVLLAAGAVWLVTSRDQDDFRPNRLGPDLVKAPVIGPEISSRTVLKGSFDVTEFSSSLIGHDTGLALGYTRCTETSGFECDRWSEEFDDRGAAAVAAFDIDSGEQLWQLDLLLVAGVTEDLGLYSVTVDADGLGNVVAYIEWLPDTEMIVVIDQDGSVVSWRSGDFELLGWHNGIVVLQIGDTIGGGSFIAAYQQDDLDQILWQVVYGVAGMDVASTLFHEPSGTFWAPTRTGFIDVNTGFTAGFGRTGDSHEYQFVPTESGPVLLQFGILDGQDVVRRIDIETRKPLWTFRVPEGFDEHVLFTLDALAINTFATDESFIYGVDYETGELLWTLDKESRLVENYPALHYGVAGHTFLIVEDYLGTNQTAISAKDGQKLFTLSCADTCDSSFTSLNVAYLIDLNEDSPDWLAGVSLEDGSELWRVEVDLPVHSGRYSIGLEFGHGRTWLSERILEETMSDSIVFSHEIWRLIG
ncbi:MAG: PQQ-binding-like beta-propeller repeat protein [Bifidobacteriaceae bacterium]|jgi:outer membrane protein assembly factor BamB|nr:PQQ-binding-like beta-propeller repeat protein [Bifidobacteriaceae bacterium]